MKQTKILFILVVAFTLTIAALTVNAAATIPVNFTAEPFISKTNDNAIVIQLKITPDSEYHFYSREQGETGRPTSISVSPALKDATVRYPAGIEAPDPIIKDKVTFLYEGAETFYITLKDTPSHSTEIVASLLLCSEVRCSPVQRTISVSWSPSELAEAESQPWWSKYTAIAPVAADNLAPLSGKDANDSKLADTLGVELPSSSGAKAKTMSSISSKSGSISLSKAPVSAVPMIKQQESASFEYDFAPRYFLQSLEVSTLSKAILFGLLAGFILNFMPCVLPVISLKLSSLVAATQANCENERKRMFREHNLFFALGILTWFVLLTIVLTSFGLAWGQIFQNEGLIIGLALLIFVLALSIFDLFPLPMFSLTGRGTENGNDKWSAYSTGLLATLLATPCSGPFLGGVLGWAFLQPLSVLVLIFLSVGIGMALPYLAMAVVPELVTRFPRSGAWTGTLSTIVGFFLLGTVVYLLSILPNEILPGMLLILWVMGMAAWAWGRFTGLAASMKRKVIVRLLCASIVGLTIFFVFKTPPVARPWQPFEPKTFFAELGNKRMIVDFSADWCPNCKVLESTVLTTENRAKWEKQYNVVFVKVDFTKDNPERQKFLESMGSNSIPVVAIFPRGEASKKPLVLRDLFTTGQFEEALEEAFAN